ncbi:MAG: hypothetical protein ABI693_25045 [Bryobacteraceae bacterium]
MSCPAHEVLEKYRNGELSPAMELEVSSHVEECGVCSLLMERLDAFDAAVTSSGQSSGERQLDRRMEQFLARQRPAPRRWRWEWALGYALALLLVYPAWLGLRPQPSLRAVPPTAVLLDLNVVRDQAPAPTLGPGSGNVVFSFFLPAKPGEHLVAKLTDNRGSAIGAPVEFTGGDGNYMLVYPLSMFPPGEYRLNVVSPEGPHVFTFWSR